MRILIVSYHFFPQNTPRAFRTYELVKELALQGHVVDLILPNHEVFKKEKYDIKNVNITFLGVPDSFQKHILSHRLANNNKIRDLAKTIYRYFNPFTNSRPYINQVYNLLKDTTVKYDMILSIAYPFVTHIGLGKAIDYNPILKSCKIKIAEYSDPFTLQNNSKIFWLYKLTDKWIARTFDYIVIPTEKALDLYTKIKSPDKIKVIPQGFNFENVILEKYTPNMVSTFAYAGIFYKKIRNPEFFFNYLITIPHNFKFILFTSPTDSDTMNIVKKYKNILGEKLEIHFNVPRNLLLTELSKMDFLINIDNVNNNQVPSKLIDYSLSKRPIYSFNENRFCKNEFEHFLSGDFSNQLIFNISPYNIKNVVNQFINIEDI